MAKKDIGDTINEAFSDKALSDDEKDFVEPPKAGSFKNNQPGDFIKGVYMGSKPFEGEYGPCIIYTIKAEKGFYNEKDIGADLEPKPAGEIIALTPGEEYGVFVKVDNAFLHDQMKHAAIGQRVIIQFTERKPSPDRKNKMYKRVTVKLDPKYVKPTEEGVGF